MDVNKVIELLNEIEAKNDLSLGICNKSHRERISELQLPECLTYLVSSHWPQTPGRARILGYLIFTTAQLFSNENKLLAEYKLLGVGSSGCGDTLAINYQSEPYPVELLNYEYEYSDEQPTAHLTLIADSLESFLKSAINNG